FHRSASLPALPSFLHDALPISSYHPGFVKTRFGSSFGINVVAKAIPFVKTPAQGADTLVWLASAPVRQLTSGGYYVKRKLSAPRSEEHTSELQSLPNLVCRLLL